MIFHSGTRLRSGVVSSVALHRYPLHRQVLEAVLSCFHLGDDGG
jgi:hypothetical protein